MKADKEFGYVPVEIFDQVLEYAYKASCTAGKTCLNSWKA
jgi:hypothetical protein